MFKKFVKEHCVFITSFLINIIFLVGITVLVGVHFELMDDWYIAKNIADGAYNVTFCNYFLQVVTGMLQKVIYPYNAFIILQIALCFVSLTTISCVFFDVFKFKKAIWLVLFIECVFAVNCYSLITFTKTAGIMMVAGGLVMLWAYHEKKPVGYSVFGIILILFGSFYRFKIFYSVLAVFGFIIIASVLSKVEKGKFFKSLFRTIKEILSVKTIALVLVMLMAVFLCKHGSDKIFYSTEDMQYYREYNSARAGVIDWEIAYYDTNVEKYESLGVSKNDYNMLKKWYFDDKGYADVETLQKIREFSESKVDVVYRVKNMVAESCGKMITFDQDGILMLAYLIVGVTVLILYKKGLLFVFFSTISVGALYTYLYIDGRIKYRVVVGLWLAAIVLLIYFTRFLETRDFIVRIKKKHNKPLKMGSVILCVALSLVFLFLTNVKMPSSLFAKNKLTIVNFNEYIKNSTEGETFVLARDAYEILRNSTVITDAISLEDEAFCRCVYFGTPYYAHPSYNKMLEEIGVDNLYTDVVDNETLHFVGMINKHSLEVDMFVTYLNEQYGDGKKYGYQLVDVVTDAHPEWTYNFGVYKIVTID